MTSWDGDWEDPPEELPPAGPRPAATASLPAGSRPAGPNGRQDGGWSAVAAARQEPRTAPRRDGLLRRAGLLLLDAVLFVAAVVSVIAMGFGPLVLPLLVIVLVAVGALSLHRSGRLPLRLGPQAGGGRGSASPASRPPTSRPPASPTGG